ncbi:hypothetical protein U1Q18_030660 [Sarracenia purpurea var. burkii]
MVLNLDLNYPTSPVDGFGNCVDVSLRLGRSLESELLQMQAATELESIDDDVVICSPRSFVEAKEKARRNREVIEVIDAESAFQRGHSESTATSFAVSSNQHRREAPKREVANSDRCIILESNEEIENKNAAEAPGMSLSIPPPKPVFNCPVCMGPFMEETSTKCGHIFCKKCICAAISAQSKCPTCRRKIKVKDTFRIYLPTSD